MRFYSTNDPSRRAVSLQEATLSGLAPDGGLYMPVQMPRLPQAFYNNMAEMTIQEVAYVVARTMLGDDVEAADLRDIVDDTFTFDIPLVRLGKRTYALELFHGPTLAVKDVGARFLARMLRLLARNLDREIHVLVATGGDLGGAVAHGFLNVPGVKVHVLYPAGRLTDMQRSQFATLGANVEALEVRGTFDDCQRMANAALLDPELRGKMLLTSGNSVNVMSLLPQMFYYFHAVSRLRAAEPNAADAVVAIPCGNLGDLAAALSAQAMGLQVRHFVAANNANDTTARYLATGVYAPAPSVDTLAAAMDVAEPSNLPRIRALFGGDHRAVAQRVTGCSFTDAEIEAAVLDNYCSIGYLMEPHTATAYLGLKKCQGLAPGIFLATAHPSKFAPAIKAITGADIAMPDALSSLLDKPWHARRLAPRPQVLKRHLLAEE